VAFQIYAGIIAKTIGVRISVPDTTQHFNGTMKLEC
jgi:hypothetical protein